jgi:3-phenylpropionate/trans-cinnamate dioxygenase ferredoxin reductase subunit
MSGRVVIVGAGQAAASSALRLKANGWGGSILILGNEGHAPYQRPPLSKKYLAGSHTLENLYIRPAQYWNQAGIEMRTNAHVDSLDLTAKRIVIGGERVSWDKLILATGSRSRAMPQAFAGRDNAFELRSIADVDRLAPVFQPGRRLVVIGGGFIGLETAAVASKAGLQVTIIERAPRILERAVCPDLSAYIREMHQANDVRVIEGKEILETVGGNAVKEVVLDDLERVAADLVLVGIGVLAEDRLAQSAGIETQNGILVDERGRSSAADVWAAGDCTAFTLRGQTIRLENVQNAIDQAEAVADDICGRSVNYAPVPWFWSDQYESKLQIVGLANGYDDKVLRQGSRGGISCWYFKAGALVAVATVDDARAYMTAKKILERGGNVERKHLSDPELDLKTLLAA